MTWEKWALLLLVLVVLLALVVMTALRPADSGQRPAEIIGGGTTVAIQEPWFGLVESGRKTVEGKPCGKDVWVGREGEIIDFQNGNRKVEGTITAIRHYPDLETYLKREWAKAAPQAKSYEDALALHMKLRMKARGKPGEGAPDSDGKIQVFSKGRIAARGGMTALELSYPSKQRLAWFGKQLTGSKKNRKRAEETLGSINNFLRKRFSHLPPKSLKEVEKRFKGWVLTGESDGRIVAALKKIHEQFPRDAKTCVQAASGRAMSRIRDISEYLTALVLSSEFPPVRAYLDVGCAEGSLTGPIGAALGLRKESEIHGCDIFATKPKNQADVRFTYTQARSEALPYKTGQFQVVSCVMSLHHFPELKRSMAELHRVLAPGGLLLIREHDSPDEFFALFLDFVHYFYAGASGDEIVLREGHETEDFDVGRQEQLIAWYRTASQWTTALQGAGFQKAHHTDGRTRDMFRSFYGFYRRA